MDTLNRTKHIIYWSLGILVLAVLGFMVWQYLVPLISRSPKTPGGATEPVSGSIGQFPEGSIGDQLQERDQPFTPRTENGSAPSIPFADQPLVQLTDYSVISPSLNEKGDAIIFYKKDGGDLMKLSFDGAGEEKLSHITIVGLTEALWSPKRDRAAVFYLDGETLKGFLHIGTSSVAVLPQNVKSFSWSPNGSQFAYATRKDAALDLIIADASGKNAKTIFSTPVLDSHIWWITTDSIAFQTAPSGFADGFVFLYSRGSGKFTKILGPLRGLSANWSSDGKRVLVSSAVSGGNTALNIYDAAGKQIFTTGLATIAQKCAWASNDRIYCASPKETAQNAVLPDDYLRGELNTVDRVVRIDLKTKETAEVFSGENAFFDASDLVLTPDEKYLFFVNRFNGTLWRIKLR